MLPALGAKPDIAFHESPDHQLLVSQQGGTTEEFLAYKGGGAPVADQGGEGLLQFPRQVGHEASAARLIGLVDAQEAVAEHEHPGQGFVPVNLSGIAVEDLFTGNHFGRDGAFERRHPEHADEVAHALDEGGSEFIDHRSGLDPARPEDVLSDGACGQGDAGR